MTSLTELVEVVIGVDTHVNTHTAAVMHAGTGGAIAELTAEATADGYIELVAFAEQHSGLRAWAAEGTGIHGAELTYHPERAGEVVIELDRPKRAQRRNGAKSDPLGAVRAAREGLARTRLGTPRAAEDRQALSVLLADRRSAVHASTDAQRQVFSVIIAAPEPLRANFRGQKLPATLRTAAALRIHPSSDLETRTTVTVLRTLPRRALTLTEEAAGHERAILVIVRSMRPDLLEQQGVGPIVAATLVCAWPHPGQIHSEAAFAMLAGIAPIPATSGKTVDRHRLNRHGDRHLNRARAYADRRTREGRSRRETIRYLRRYIARDLYRLLEHPA